jgi:beta-lactamase superfamily II metal-dependent hydrolase
VISLELLPAAHGDSIWIEYGSESQSRLHRVLIDGGPAHTYESALRRRISMVPEDERTLDLMVVTHIDADHIDGALILLQERSSLKVRINDMWFNGWNQLPAKTGRDAYAPLQGEFLSGLIGVDAALKAVWNKGFKGKAVVVDESNPFPEIALDGGAKLILLGPTRRELDRLRARWASAIRDFSPGDEQEALRRLRERREYRPPAAPAVFAIPQFGDDRTPANGSSISFVFEHGKTSLLLAADAHAKTLADSLKRLAEQRSTTRLRFDAVKVPHHGSMSNISQEWLQWIDCDRWLISTNGAIFNHPDVQTAELIAQHCRRPGQRPPTILCNYRSSTTARLEERADGRWVTAFPEAGGAQGPVGGLRLQWPSSQSSDQQPGAADAGETRSGKKRPQKRATQARKKRGTR